MDEVRVTTQPPLRENVRYCIGPNVQGRFIVHEMMMSGAHTLGCAVVAETAIEFSEHLPLLGLPPGAVYVLSMGKDSVPSVRVGMRRLLLSDVVGRSFKVVPAPRGFF